MDYWQLCVNWVPVFLWQTARQMGKQLFLKMGKKNCQLIQSWRLLWDDRSLADPEVVLLRGFSLESQRLKIRWWRSMITSYKTFTVWEGSVLWSLQNCLVEEVSDFSIFLRAGLLRWQSHRTYTGLDVLLRWAEITSRVYWTYCSSRTLHNTVIDSYLKMPRHYNTCQKRFKTNHNPFLTMVIKILRLWFCSSFKISLISPPSHI